MRSTTPESPIEGNKGALRRNVCCGCFKGAKVAEHTIQVVDMRVEAAGLGECWVEAELPVPDVPRPPKCQPGGHHLDMALAQRVVDHILILLHLTIACTLLMQFYTDGDGSLE